MNLQEIAVNIIKKIPFEAEVFIVKSKHLNINVLNQKIESIENGDEFGIGLRVIKNKQLGFAYSTNSEAGPLIEQALANADSAHKDEFNTIAEPSTNKVSLDQFDKEIGKVSVDKKIETALKIEKAAHSFDKRVNKSETCGYSDSEVEVCVCNSKRINSYYKSNYCGGSAQVICEAEGEADEGFAVEYVTKWKDLDPEKIGKEAAQKAVELFKGTLIDSGKIPVVFDPMVGAEFLDTIASMLSADSVQKGKSALAGKIGKLIANPIIELIDDPHLIKGLSSSPYDDEGVATIKKSVIKNGILQEFLHNSYTAAKDGIRSTGNAARAGFRSLPGIGTYNLHFAGGKKKPDDLIKGISKGLYVTRVMAMHSVNTISGDFSVGAAGIMIENGKKTFPVRGITIAGNLLELLHSIEEIGDDLRFFPIAGNCGSPTLLISSLSIGGK